MGPEGKKPRNVRSEAADVSDGLTDNGYLDGQLLIAMPVMGDPRFERSVIYVCAHSSEGAMGIIVNRPAGSIDFPELLVQLDIIKEADQIKLPENAESMKVLKGGPVETGRGFVLHSSDFFIKDATLRIDDGICLTATVDILKAIARGAGPKHAILALGYAGWAPGQLERNPGQWLAALRRRPGFDLRRRRRGKIPARLAQDRDRSGHAVERSRARVERFPSEVDAGFARRIRAISRLAAPIEDIDFRSAIMAGGEACWRNAGYEFAHWRRRYAWRELRPNYSMPGGLRRRLNRRLESGVGHEADVPYISINVRHRRYNGIGRPVAVFRQ